MIVVEKLTKEFKASKKEKNRIAEEKGRSKAVNEVDFVCKPGRVFSLLGPNGAGKTTLLRMLATILKPTSGKITIEGYDAVEDSIEVRRNIGFLTGSTGLYERLTPTEFIKFFADLYEMDANTFKRRKKDLFEMLGVEEFANKQIGKLSTGMKQKVSICRTIIHDPQVVIFDEPTSGLDVITAKNIIQLIRNCKDQGKTVIFSSHIMEEVSLLCDDLAIIDKGELLYNGSMEIFKSQMETENLTEEFIRIVSREEVLVK